MCIPEWDPGTEKGHCIKTKEIWRNYEVKWKSLSRVWLCDPMDYTVCGILQARILEWVAFPFSSESSQPRYWTQDFN